MNQDQAVLNAERTVMNSNEHWATHLVQTVMSKAPKMYHEQTLINNQQTRLNNEQRVMNKHELMNNEQTVINKQQWTNDNEQWTNKNEPWTENVSQRATF